jgi:3-carboxy-cis,cis-muconate cycloisomerase
VPAVLVQACAQRLPGLVATMHASQAAEHERAAGGWHAEWETFSDALRLTGSASTWAVRMVEVLEVDTERMRVNLQAAGEAAGAEPESCLETARALVDRALAEYGEGL